jgi:hypothetical protein
LAALCLSFHTRRLPIFTTDASILLAHGNSTAKTDWVKRLRQFLVAVGALILIVGYVGYAQRRQIQHFAPQAKIQTDEDSRAIQFTPTILNTIYSTPAASPAVASSSKSIAPLISVQPFPWVVTNRPSAAPPAVAFGTKSAPIFHVQKPVALTNSLSIYSPTMLITNRPTPGKSSR